MSIRIKVSLITSLVFLIITAGIYLLVANIIRENFTKIEKDEVNTNLDRIINAIQSDIADLNTKSADWSHWDETYQFIIDRNSQYLNSNVTPKALTDLNISFMSFYDSQKQLIASQVPDPSNPELEKIRSELIAYFQENPRLFSPTGPDSYLSGVTGLESKPVSVSIRPVTNSEGNAPTKGWLVYAHILDDKVTREIKNTTRLEFTLVPTDSEDKPQFTGIVSSTPSTLIAQTSLEDIDQDAHYLIRLTLPRSTYIEGQNSIRIFTNSFIVFSFVCLIIFIILLDRLVVHPISKLSREFSNIINAGDLNHKLNIQQRDEIGNLGQLINKLLHQIVVSEAELISERDKAQSIISSMGEGLLLIDTNHRISMINPAAEKLLETTRAKALGLPWSDLVSASEGDKIIPLENRTFPKVISTGKPIITTIDNDHYYITRSGNKFPLASVTTPLFDRNHKIIGAVKIFRDITHDKSEMLIIEEKVKTRTEELREKNTALQKAQYEISRNWTQLQQEKARLTTSLNSLPIGFILIDKNSDIILINQTAKDILGFRSEKIALLSQIEEKISQVYNLSAAINSCLNEKKTLQVPEILYGRKFINLFVSPIYMESASKPSYVGTAVLISDITDEKNLSRSRDEFFSIASHELRTPLTAIRGNASLILDNFTDQIQNPDLKEMITDIHNSSTSLIDIVNEFLKLSRLELGRIEFKKEQFDLVQLLNEAVNELCSQASSKNLNLSIDPASATSLQINSDRDRIKEVVINLIGNSIKYTENGSISVKVNSAGNKTVVEVTDTGRGIPESQQNLLFRKFQQTGESLYTRDTSKSTGLGLYISKLIIEGLGGEVGLSWSEPGKGSCFFFTLPSP